jgi:hypothetical protein
MKRFLLAIALQLFVLQILCAQPISESLGGIKTNFEVFTINTDLEVTEQIILLTTERFTYINPQGEAGWGYGYQSFHFEFITKNEIKEIQGDKNNRHNYRLSFIDHENVILLAVDLPKSSVNKYHNPDIPNSQFFYSIDLINIPILLLDKTKRIDLYRFK